MSAGYHGPPVQPGHSRRLKRRMFMRLLTASAGTPALIGLLAACGGAATTPTIVPSASATTSTSGMITTTGVATPPGVTGATLTVGGAATPSGATGATGGAPGGQVSFHWSKPVTFDPLFSTAGVEQGIEQLVLGALVKVTDGLEAVPDIAEKIDVSPDVTTYTFTLHKDLQFTDGKPLTAKDVIFTYERAIDKRVGSYWGGRLLDIVGAADYGQQKADHVTGLEMPDDYTVKMTLTHPDATWLLTLGDFAGLGILPAHVFAGVAPDQLRQHPFSLKPDTSAGVFQFVQYQTDQFVELKRNEGYGGTKAKLDRLFGKILTTDAALAQLDQGELDLMILPIGEVERVKRNPNLTVVSVPSPSIDFLSINLEKAYLQDKRVRQAMMYALDREAIVKEIYQGQAQLVNQTIIGPDWMGMPQVNPYPFDPNKAKQLLKDANWDSGHQLDALYYPGSRERDAYAPILQQLLKDVGINITLRSLELAEYTRLRNASTFDLAFVGGGIFRQDPNVSGKYFETVNFVPTGANYSHYSNKRVDELFATGRATSDRARRKQIYTEAATILNDEVPWLFLWSPNSIFGHNKRLVGFKPPNYATHDMWNADQWTVTK